jgi:integrase
MAYIRQLPSGKWAATVRLPGDERVTETFRLKGHADDWAADLEADIRRQDWVDPRGGKTTVAEVWQRWGAGRRLERSSKERDASHYRTYVEPRWGKVPVGAILKPDIDAWITEMEGRKPTPVKATSIQPAVGVLRAVLQLAVDARLIKFNVATMVKAPARAAHLDRVLDDDEAETLLANAEKRFPGKSYAALFLEVLLYAGLRYGEAAALNRDWVETRRRLLHVGPTMLKDGTIKDKPKSRAGIRPVPVDDVLWPKLREHVLTIPPGGLLFTAERGGELLYDHWRDRVWSRCLTTERDMTAAEIEAWKAEQLAAGKKRAWRPRWVVEVPVLDSPLPTPHDLRHTYGTRLGEAGVPQHEIMALMGHEDPESVQRYLHAREGRFDKARAAMVAARLAGQR